MENTFEYSKWLRGLLITAVVSFVNGMVNYIPFVPAALTAWISRGVMVAKIICIFQLVPLNGRYRKVGFLRAVMLACALITSFLFGSYLLTVLSLICSTVAVYQEYRAHGELVEEKDEGLSRKWNSLFWWDIGANFLLSLGSSIAAIVLVAAGPQISAGSISGVVNALMKIPTYVISVMYMLYLKKTIPYFASEERETD